MDTLITPEELQVERMALSVLAKDDSPDGFSAFFQLIYPGMRLTKFARGWIDTLYKAREEQKHLAAEAARGLAKTTVLTIAFALFRIGLEPHKSNLLIQVGDDIAKDNTGQMANIIEYNPGWKMAFPNVVPDKERGWSNDGYNVKDTSIPPDEWNAKNATRKDPTFIGLGYGSHSIIGKRPTGVLVIDDILDQKTTSSDRIMQDTKKVMNANIFPAIVPETWVILVFTPWREDDPIVELSKSSLFMHVKTPAYVEDDDGDTFKPLNKKIKLTWKKERGMRFLEDQFELNGPVDFARMFALDLTKTDSREFKWYDFPSHLVKFDWVMAGGADYASSLKNISGAKTDSDYYALAYVAKIPEGGVVVVDGVLEKATLLDALYYVEKAQEMFPGWLNTVVESDGKGTEFLQSIWMMKPNLKITPSSTKGENKTIRLRRMAPMFATGRVRVSDASSPFLDELRRELRQFPNCNHDDAMDAVFWALTAVMDALVVPKSADTLRKNLDFSRENPFASLGRR